MAVIPKTDVANNDGIEETDALYDDDQDLPIFNGEISSFEVELKRDHEPKGKQSTLIMVMLIQHGPFPPTNNILLPFPNDSPRFPESLPSFISSPQTNSPSTPHSSFLLPTTASWWHSAFHTTCAVVGAGVLGLPHSFSILGWAGGFFTLTTLCIISIYTSYILSNLHEREHKRYNTYRQIGESIWGPRIGTLAVVPVQFSLMVGLCITYSVTAGESMKGVVDSRCLSSSSSQIEGEGGEECGGSIAPWIIMFGMFQLALSQVPDFHSLWWVSLLGGIMSVGYCSIATGASWAHLNSSSSQLDDSGSHNSTGSNSTTIDDDNKEATSIFSIFNALGTIAFTFGGQAVLPEIQATLARPPSTATSMMKGISVSYIIVIIAYYSVAIAGYAAYGTSVKEDVLLSITDPSWLVQLADMMVVIHVAAGYQVFAMPIFDAIETSVRKKLVPAYIGNIKPVMMRLVVRSTYVVITTVVACLLPFFGDLMGLIASIGLMPVTFILPPIMWLAVKKRVGMERWINISIIGGCSVLALLAFIGSTRNIAVDAKNFDILG